MEKLILKINLKKNKKYFQEKEKMFLRLKIK